VNSSRVCKSLVVRLSGTTAGAGEQLAAKLECPVAGLFGEVAEAGQSGENTLLRLLVEPVVGEAFLLLEELGGRRRWAGGSGRDQ